MKTNNAKAIKELSEKAEFFGLHQSERIPEKDRNILKAANKDKRLLNTVELNSLSQRSNCDIKKIQELQDNLPYLIDDAKKKLLKKMPNITEPGGSLYPKERAEACWRDCFHFARISIYGTAAGDAEIINQESLIAIRELYAILNVPVNALTICLKELQLNCGEFYEKSASKKDFLILNSCFDHLIKTMKSLNI